MYYYLSKDKPINGKQVIIFAKKHTDGLNKEFVYLLSEPYLDY